MIKYIAIAILFIALMTLIILGIAFLTPLGVKTGSAYYGSQPDVVLISIDRDRATILLEAIRFPHTPVPYTNLEGFEESIEIEFNYNPGFHGLEVVDMAIDRVEVYVIDSKGVATLKSLAGYPPISIGYREAIDKLIKRYRYLEILCSIKRVRSVPIGSVYANIWSFKCGPLDYDKIRSRSRSTTILLAVSIDIKRSRFVDQYSGMAMDLHSLLTSGNTTLIDRALTALKGSSQLDMTVNYRITPTLQQVVRASIIMGICIAILYLYYKRSPEELESLLKIFRKLFRTKSQRS